MLIDDVFFSAMPDYGQTMYGEGVALYDTLETADSKMHDTEYVAYPVRIQLIMFILCINGRMKTRMNLKNYDLTNGDLIVVRPNTIIESLQLSVGTRVTALTVSDTFYHLFPRKHVSTSGPLPAVDPMVLHMEQPVMDHLITIYHQMRALISAEDFNYKEDALQGYLQVVGSILESIHEHDEAQKEKDDGNTKSSRQKDIYTRFVRDVNQHFRQHRDIAFYAGLQCVTPKYFGQMVRRACNRQPADIISEHVILEAKILLRSQHYTVQQVCNMLNFPNPSFFGKYFKAHVGQTPRQFAEQTAGGRS